MKEALFYQKVEGDKVRCELCPHLCIISAGKKGICGVRANQKGALYTLVYDKIISANIDPIEKKPLFHFLPGSRSYSIATAGCNFRCDFCQNYEISQMPREQHIIPGEGTEPKAIVEEALKYHCRSISYTYTEPTIYYELAHDTARLANAKGLKNVFVTNGFINAAPLEMIAPYLNAANIDLKSFRDDYYRKICGGKLQPVLDAIRLYKKLDIWLEITTLVIPGLNDSKDELTEIAGFIKEELGAGTPWHVSAFYPTYKMLDRPRTSPSKLMEAREIGFKAGLKYVYCGNVYVPGSEDTSCPKCKSSLIVREGFEVMKNSVANGKCSNCGEAIEGVWS